MPKVVGYTAPWLSRPAPGSRIFSDPAPQSPGSPSKQRNGFPDANGSGEYQGPRRLIARRGTEIFTVVGNKIRWANLVTIKDSWIEKRHTKDKGGNAGPSEENAPPGQYRTLTAPVFYQIRQLVISPSGVFLAICTEHTIHIAVLPDSSRLSDNDSSPLKLKTYQLGPTTHVIPESPVVSALWHPLAVATESTDCLVTITSESAVRVWELDRANRSSFERPSLAIDLKRLLDATSSDEDVEPSGFGKSRGFSVDVFDMEASAACFGGQGRNEENGWASMTLWTSMRNGDVYALCPLLPSKWVPTSTTIPSLSTASVAKLATLHDVSDDQERAAWQQYEWVQEIDSSEPMELPVQGEDSYREVRLRPSNPGAIPRLQGPFDMPLDEELEISDIHVFAAHLDDAELMSGEDGYGEFDAENGLPFTLICLATTNGDVRIAMDSEGVSGQWLSKRGRNSFSVPDPDVQELLLIETLLRVADVSSNELSASWPVFTVDSNSDYSLFLNGAKQITSISLADWASRMGMEIASTDPVDAGLETRLRTTCSNQISVHSEVLNIMDSNTPADEKDNLSAPVILDSPDLGYFLLTATESQAYSLSFDTSHLESIEYFERSRSEYSLTPLTATLETNADLADVPIVPQRSPYASSSAFYMSATAPLNERLTKNLPQRQRMTLTQTIRLSPATLDLMTSAHRVLSSQTQQLDRAAAELFRQCERMREELGDQVKQMADLADKLQNLGQSADVEDDAPASLLDERIEKARNRQAEMQKRFEDLRRKSGRVKGKKELSEKEVAWVGEIGTLGRVVGVNQEEPQVGGSGGLGRRYEQLQLISKELLDESEKIVEVSKDQQKDGKSSPGGTVLTGFYTSSKMQKAKLAEAMSMVEREAAVIEAVQARLQKMTAEYNGWD